MSNYRSAAAPPFIVVCGPPGAGKTVDIIRAVGPGALVAAAEGALRPVEPLLGIEAMQEFQVETIEDATKALTNLRKALSNGYKGPRPSWFVADEFSYMADRTMAGLERRYSGFAMWGKLREVCIGFRDAARSSGVGVIANCWDVGPTTKSSGKFVRGGPRLPADLPEQFPGIADYVILAQHAPGIQPWPYVYRTMGDNNWALKNRDNATPAIAPMNLGEILRAAGHDTPFAPAREKLESQVDAMADALVALPTSSQIAACEQYFGALVSAGHDPRFAKWAVTDARDRALLRAARVKRWATFAAQ